MKPRSQKDPQEDLFRVRLEKLVDGRQPLVRLSKVIPWQKLEEQFGAHFEEKFGRPGIPTRLMAGVHYLKYSNSLSDEEVCKVWSENPYWQYFCGAEFFEYKEPFDRSSMTRWRNQVGPKGAEELLKATIESALVTNTITEKELTEVAVDTTVQEKNVTFPTDTKLLYRCGSKLVSLAKELDVELRQSYVRVSRKALIQANRYFHARQAKRAKKQVRKLRTYLGRIMRDISRKIEGDSILVAAFSELLGISEIILNQKRDSNPKVYSIHAPEVECIAKGKAHKKYEFGVKVGLVATLKSGFVVACDAHHGNPYDGHTLSESLVKSVELIGKEVIERAFVDRGYRGHNYQGKALVMHAGQKPKNRADARKMKRRPIIEAVISRLKSQCRMDRNYLHGKDGDRVNAILSAAGYNFRMILKAVVYLMLRISGFFTKMLAVPKNISLRVNA